MTVALLIFLLVVAIIWASFAKDDNRTYNEDYGFKKSRGKRRPRYIQEGRRVYHDDYFEEEEDYHRRRPRYRDQYVDSYDTRNINHPYDYRDERRSRRNYDDDYNYYDDRRYDRSSRRYRPDEYEPYEEIEVIPRNRRLRY